MMKNYLRKLTMRRWRLLLAVVLGINLTWVLMRHDVTQIASPASRHARDVRRDVVVKLHGERVIGYACDGSCGGWADRQKGIVAAYILSLILRQRFKIWMPNPCELGFFLSPRGSVDWQLKPGELEGKQVIIRRHLDNTTFATAELMPSKDPLSDLFYAEYNFITVNMELVQILKQHTWGQRVPWLYEMSVPEIYRRVLFELFDLMPGPRIQMDTFWHTVSPNKSLICAQIRMGGGTDTETFNTFDQLTNLATFLAPFNTSLHRFMFTSDNPTVIEKIRSYFPSLVVAMDGPVTHVDRSTGGGVCGGFQRAIVEQMVLSSCDMLVISESGLGKIAAFLRNTDKNLYIFHDGKVESFMRHQKFPNRVAW